MYFILVDSGRTDVLGERRQRGAALHPLRRVHESLPGVPERRRPFVRLGLPGADRLDPDADVRRPRERARPAAGVDAVQPVRRRVPGEDPAAGPAAQAAREGIRAPAAAVVRARRRCARGRGSRAARALRRSRPRVGVRAAALARRSQRHDPQAAARRAAGPTSATCRRPRAARSASFTPRAPGPRDRASRQEQPDERPASATRRDDGPAVVAPRRLARHRERVRRARRSQRAGAQRQGHRVVLHRPAGFPDAAQHPGRRDRRDPRRQARLHAVGGHRRAARRRGARPGRAARPRHSRPTTSSSPPVPSRSSPTRSRRSPTTASATK